MYTRSIPAGLVTNTPLSKHMIRISKQRHNNIVPTKLRPMKVNVHMNPECNNSTKYYTRDYCTINIVIL